MNWFILFTSRCTRGLKYTPVVTATRFSAGSCLQHACFLSNYLVSHTSSARGTERDFLALIFYSLLVKRYSIVLFFDLLLYILTVVCYLFAIV